MDYLMHILVIGGIYCLLAAGLNLSLGYTGMPNLGHAAFYCVGAYSSALLTLHCHLPTILGVLAGGLIAAAFAAAVAVPAVRIRGDYLALATFAAGAVVFSVANNAMPLTRGPIGLSEIPHLRLGFFTLTKSWHYVLLLTGLLLVASYTLCRLVRSPFGAVLTAIREDETATLVMGKNVIYYKTLALMVGAFWAGLAGAVYAHYVSFIEPSSFSPAESIAILLMVVLGGMGTLVGPLLGATFLIALPEAMRFVGLPISVAAPLRQLIYGLLLMLLVLVRPQGLVGKYKWK